MKVMRMVAVLAVLVLFGALALSAPESGEAGLYSETFGGGTLDPVLYAANDHTAFAFRWEATSGLEPDTDYRLKVRFIVGTEPSPGTNRGYTWNPATGEWVQESESWELFPIVHASSAGTIAANWVNAKFGDESKSGPYRLMVSLKPVDGSTYNSSYNPVVTVFDVRTAGMWLHNAVATGKSSATRAELAQSDDSNVVYTLRKTELDVVDSDGDGAIDNAGERRPGVAPGSGDFRFAMPTGMTCDVRLNRAAWAPGNDIPTGSTPDVAISVGASETQPPSMVTGLRAVVDGSGDATLTWSPANDTGGSGIAGYAVYSRVTTTAPRPYTEPQMFLGSTTATTFSDSGLARGTTYEYVVRAYDASGNVGPRSAAASVTPVGEAQTARVWGTDRYKTALAVSSEHWADSSVTTVVVATGNDFPDALSACGLAGVFGSPVLLTGSSVTAELSAEIDRLGATDVVLVGGVGVVPEAVATSLEDTWTVTRVSGDDRFGTAAAVYEAMRGQGVDVSEAYFVRGDAFPDAVAVSPFCYATGRPVLLVRVGSVPDATSDAITDGGLTGGIVAGGTGAVDATCFTQLNTLLPGTPVRVWGTDRYATAAAVAEHGADNFAGFGFVGIASGAAFPDALTGGAAAGAEGGVLLLVRPDAVPAAVSAVLTERRPWIDEVEVYGGTGAITSAGYSAIEAALAVP